MTVHFCPHCGRLNLADFLFCPYCGESVAPGPSLADILDEPFDRLESSARGRMGERIQNLETLLLSLESDIDELLTGASSDGDRKAQGALRARKSAEGR